MKVARISSRVRFAAGTFALTLMLAGNPAQAVTKWEQFSQAGEKAYMAQDFPEAEKQFQAALKEAEKFDKTDKRLATTVYNLALIYQSQGRWADAEKEYAHSLELLQAVYGPVHDRVAQVYSDLADMYRSQLNDTEDRPGTKAKAAAEYKKAVEAFEKVYEKVKTGGTSQPAATGATGDAKGPLPIGLTRSEAATTLGKTLNSFADMYAEDDEFDVAEPYYKRAIEIESGELGPNDPQVAKDKAHLAEFYCVQGRYAPAEPLYKEAIEALEKNEEGNPLELANVQYNFGGLFYDQGNFGRAENYFKKALRAYEDSSSQNEQDLALKRIALADCIDMQGRNEEAGAIYKKSISALEKGEDITQLAAALKSYHKHLLMTNNKDEAAKIQARLKEIKAKRKQQAAE